MITHDSQLSKYFKGYEVSKSDTASRSNIDNTPTQEIYTNAQELAVNVLDKIRVQFGSFSPNSWYRSEALEKAICNKDFIKWCKNKGLDARKKESWQAYFARKSHPRGQAADITVAGVSNDVLFDWIVKNLDFDQVIREFAIPGQPFSGWVHVSWNGKNNRKQVLHIG